MHEQQTADTLLSDLRRRELLLARIAEDSPNFIVAVDVELRVTAANRAFREEFPRVFGAEVVLGRALPDVLAHLPDQQAAVEALCRAAIRGESGILLAPFGPADAPRLFEVRYQPLVGEDGIAEGAWAAARDVTEQERSRAEIVRLTSELESTVRERTLELRDSEKQRRLAMAAAGVGDWELDPRTEGVYWSPRSRELLGFGLDEPASLRDLIARVHPDDRRRIASALAVSLHPDGAGLFQVEFRMALPDGEARWVEAHGRTEFADGRDGRQATVVRGVLLDVTERRRAERERLRMDQILERISEAYWSVDAEWRLTYVNHGAEQMWGRSRDELLGRVAWDVFPAVRGSESFANIQRTMETGQPSHYETISPVTGRWIAASVYPGIDGGAFVFFRDISARKAAEREREELLAREHMARMQAQEASRAKSEFLTIMSHELRTPLNAIAGYGELLEMGLHGPVTDEQRESLQRIQSAGRHLLGLIDEVMQLARIERQAVSYRMAPVPVRELLAAADALILPQMHGKELAFTCATPDDALHVHADAEKLRQILLNLLGNAVKFTDPGGRVALDCEADAHAVRLHVRDTGRGIPADKLDAVFDPFVQVDARLTRSEQGMGLGLAISRELARGMGGELSVASEVGVGSVFTLRLARAALG